VSAATPRALVVTTTAAVQDRVERGLHRFEAEIADAEQHREAVEVVGWCSCRRSAVLTLNHVVVPGFERGTMSEVMWMT